MKGVRADCVSCGDTGRWNLLSDGDGNAHLLALKTDTAVEGEEDVGFGAYGMACGNCGHIVLFLLDVLNREAEQLNRELPQPPLH